MENIQKNKTDYELIEIEQFKNTRCKTYCILNVHNLLDFYEFFKATSSLIISKLIELCSKSSYKLNLHVDCAYENILTDEVHDIVFKTLNRIVYAQSNFNNLINVFFNKLLKEESDFITNGSGWSLKSIYRLQLRTNKVNLLKGNSYIKLSKKIQNTNSVINVDNNDINCFKYAILSKYHVHDNKSRFNKKYFNILEKNSNLNFKCINFPTPLKQINKFERFNNVSINVYSIDDKNMIYPIKVTNNEKHNHFDLMYKIIIHLTIVI